LNPPSQSKNASVTPAGRATGTVPLTTPAETFPKP
jgi:hypothetical protein